jgi:hypothetical protein
MHVLDGAPAYFDGDQIVFAAMEIRRLAKSLKQIRQERALDRKFSKKIGRVPEKESAFRYIRIRVDEEEE